MNGLLNMGPRTAQSFWNHNNANSLGENEPPRVFESSESVIGYSQDTGAAPGVLLQALRTFSRVSSLSPGMFVFAV